MFLNNRLRWTGLLILVALSLFLYAGCSWKENKKEAIVPKPSQEQLAKLELFNRTAEEFYQKTLQADITGSRMSLQQLGDQITQIHFEGITTIEGMNALTETITQAKRVFNAVKFRSEEAQVYAAKIRLAADALIHTNQPLWLQYYKLLQDDVNLLERGAVQNNKQDLQKGANQLEIHYSIIHPSLLISRNASDVEKMDSLVAFVKNQAFAQENPYKNIQNAIPPIRQMLDKLFMKRETTAYLPYIDQQNPVLWTLAFGAIILSALAFAGWRLARKNDGIVIVRGGKRDSP